MRLTEIQTSVLQTLETMPKLSRELIRKYQRDYTSEQMQAYVSALVTAGYVEVDKYDMHSITEEGAARLLPAPNTAAPRQHTNGTTRGIWGGTAWRPVRPGADDHLRHKSLTGRPTGVNA